MYKVETVGDVYRRYDSGGSGMTDVGGVNAALADLGVPISSPEAAQTVGAALQSAGAAGLSKDDFRALVKSLKALAGIASVAP